MLTADPLYALQILFAGWPEMVNTLLSSTFFGLLLLFWIVMMDGIAKEGKDRSAFKFYFWKVVLCGLIWISLVVLFGWTEYHNMDDPQYNFVEDVPGWKVFYIFLAVLLAVYTVLLFLALFKASW